MKKYLICSDIHRRVERLKEILKKEKGLDGIIIAGDIEADSDEIRQLAGEFLCLKRAYPSNHGAKIEG